MRALEIIMGKTNLITQMTANDNGRNDILIILRNDSNTMTNSMIVRKRAPNNTSKTRVQNWNGKSRLLEAAHKKRSSLPPHNSAFS